MHLARLHLFAVFYISSQPQTSTRASRQFSSPWCGNLNSAQLPDGSLLRCQGSLLNMTRHTSPNYFLLVLTCTCHCHGSVAFLCLVMSGTHKAADTADCAPGRCVPGICWLLISAFMLLLQKMTQGTLSPHTGLSFL